MKEEAKSMDCAQFAEIVHDLERPGTEGFALRDGALAHAETCSQCARLMTNAESLDAGLRALAAQEAGQQAPFRVGAALTQEFRRQKFASTRRRVQRQVGAIAEAAVVLLALGFSLSYRAVRPNGTTTATNDAAQKPASQVVSPVAAPTNSQQPAGTPENQADDSEYATNFVPLPYADDHTETDGGTVVRVVLSRPALASLGVPVTDPGATDEIPADLLLSEDGAPQAIRLVSRATVEQ
jgi:hypothetical protein